MELKLSLTLSTARLDNRLKGVKAIMSDWIDDTKRRQEQEGATRERREKLLGDLCRIFFAELRDEIAANVERINQTYPHIYNRNTNNHLVFMDMAVGEIEVRIGATTVLEVVDLSGSHSLKVTRLYPKVGAGQNKQATEHYHLKLDGQDNLYLEAKDGRTIIRNNARQELLGYLLDVQ